MRCVFWEHSLPPEKLAALRGIEAGETFFLRGGRWSPKHPVYGLAASEAYPLVAEVEWTNANREWEIVWQKGSAHRVLR